MSAYIPVFLALFAGLIGLLGNTTDPKKPLIHRLTRIGYLALFVILATSILGIWSTRKLLLEQRRQEDMRKEVRTYALAQIRKYCCMALEPYDRILNNNFEFSTEEEFMIDSNSYFQISSQEAKKLLDSAFITRLSSLDLSGQIMVSDALAVDNFTTYASVIKGDHRHELSPSLASIRGDLGPYLQPDELVLINKLSNSTFESDMEFAASQEVPGHQMPADVLHAQAGSDAKIIPPLPEFTEAYTDYVSSLISLLEITEKQPNY